MSGPTASTASAPTFSGSRTKSCRRSSVRWSAGSRPPTRRGRAGNRRPAWPPMNACCRATPCPGTMRRAPQRRRACSRRRSRSTPAMASPTRCWRSCATANGATTSPARMRRRWTNPSAGQAGGGDRRQRKHLLLHPRSGLRSAPIVRPRVAAHAAGDRDQCHEPVEYRRHGKHALSCRPGGGGGRLVQACPADRSVLRSGLVLAWPGPGVHGSPPL